MSMSNASYIKLDQFLKRMQVTASGGQAKVLIQSGQVMVNGDIETRRGRKLVVGDQVSLWDAEFEVTSSDLSGLA